MGDLQTVALISATAAELLIIALMISGREFRAFPAFFLFLCWSLFSDWFLFYVRHSSLATDSFQIYLVQLVIDSAMIFALLVEIAWSILRPIRKSLPKYSWIGIAVLVALGALILWPIAGLTAPDSLSDLGRKLFLLQQIPAILRAVFFLALVAFSQLLSIGWRDRELQIATGLGFYSIVSLAVTTIHTHQAVGAQYEWLDVVAGLSYVAALFYWDYSFATKPAERREFSPQMQSMLLAVAGAAHSTRVALGDAAADRSNKHRDR